MLFQNSLFRFATSTSRNGVHFQCRSLSQTKQPMVKYNVTPVKLFRISTTLKVALREYGEQKKLGRVLYDYVASVDKVVPSRDCFEKPNGMSLRPQGSNISDVLALTRGKVNVFIIPEGTVIPPELVLFLEHSDHYSLQTSTICSPLELNTSLTTFLSKMEKISKKEYFERYPI